MVCDTPQSDYYIRSEVNKDRTVFLPEAVAPRTLKMFNTAIFTETPFSRDIVLIHYEEGSSPLMLDVNAGKCDPSVVLQRERLPFEGSQYVCQVKGNALEIYAPYTIGLSGPVDTRVVESAIIAFKTIARRYHWVTTDRVSVHFHGYSKLITKEWRAEMDKVMQRLSIEATYPSESNQ